MSSLNPKPVTVIILSHFKRNACQSKGVDEPSFYGRNSSCYLFQNSENFDDLAFHSSWSRLGTVPKSERRKKPTATVKDTIWLRFLLTSLRTPAHTNKTLLVQCIATSWNWWLLYAARKRYNLLPKNNIFRHIIFHSITENAIDGKTIAISNWQNNWDFIQHAHNTEQGSRFQNITTFKQ